MIIGIDMGHTIRGTGYGAIGMLHESIEVRNIGRLVIKYLQELGHTVIDCTVDVSNQDITDRVIKANKQYLDLFVSIHLNASNGNGNGVEVLTANGKQLPEALRVLDEISKLDFRNRGIKNGTSPRRLGVVNSTKAPAMLIECFFCDNKGDVNRYDPDTMARAIVKGITGQDIKNKGDDTVKFNEKWQEDLLLNTIQNLSKKGVINSADDWINKFKLGKLTSSELSLLALVAADRVGQ